MVKIIDKGNGKASVLFTVEMPMDIYDEFTYMCKKDYSNVFWLCIKDLMSLGRVARVQELFMDEMDYLRQEVAELKETIKEKLEQEVDEEPVGLGSAAFRKWGK